MNFGIFGGGVSRAEFLGLQKEVADLSKLVLEWVKTSQEAEKKATEEILAVKREARKKEDEAEAEIEELQASHEAEIKQLKAETNAAIARSTRVDLRAGLDAEVDALLLEIHQAQKEGKQIDLAGLTAAVAKLPILRKKTLNLMGVKL